MMTTQMIREAMQEFSCFDGCESCKKTINRLKIDLERLESVENLQRLYSKT